MCNILLLPNAKRESLEVSCKLALCRFIENENINNDIKKAHVNENVEGPRNE